MVRTNKNKRPIEWHEECLKNKLISMEILRREALRAQDELLGCEIEIEKYGKQIEIAKLRHMDGFDVERFLK